MLKMILPMLIVSIIGYSYTSYKLYSFYLTKFPPYVVIPISMIIFFSFIIFKVLEYWKGIIMPPQVMFVSYMIMGVSIYLLLGFIVTDLLSLVKLKTVLGFQIKYIALILVFIICSFGYYNQLKPKLTTYNINTEKKLAKDLKILFVSDIHIDDIMSDKKLEKYVEIINNVEADILLIGGDIIDKNINDLTSSKKAILSQLNKKSYAVLGNHDYYAGDIDRVIAEIETTGIKMLRDEIIEFEGINIVGRDTRAKSFNGLSVDNRKPLEKLVGINKDNFTVVVEHIPDRTSIKENIDFKSDMMLSGHTHGGQFFPVTLIVKYTYDNGYGLKYFENLATIVSSGIDLWGARLRIGSISEIVLINLSMK